MSNHILEIKNLSKSFVRNIKNTDGEIVDESKILLKNLSLKIERGKITALVGGNGTGKTTLFNIISGLLEADSGEVSYNTNTKKYSLYTLKPYEIARLGIGRMFQDSHIFSDLSVLENMCISDDEYYGEGPIQSILNTRKLKQLENKRKKEALEIFERFLNTDNSFYNKKDHPASSLSFGQQRLLGLFRLFMAKYNLLLLDEPTAGVNPQLILRMEKIIKAMVNEVGVTVFLIEHNMPFVRNVADRSAFLSDGNVQFYGKTEDVLNIDEIKKTYLFED